MPPPVYAASPTLDSWAYVQLGQQAAGLVAELEEKRERQLRALRTLAQIEVDLGAQLVGDRNDGPPTGH